MKIILASQSATRKELMDKMGIEYTIMPSDLDEVIKPNLSFSEVVMDLAKQKAKHLYSLTQGDRFIIGSDTIVVADNEIFCKPKNEDDARRMLRKLSGNTHSVFTGLCVLVERKKIKSEYIDFQQVKITFNNLPDEIIEKYLKSGQYKERAGAYAILGVANCFVDKVEGNYSSIAGLPTNLLFKIFLKEKINFLNFDKNLEK